MLEKSREEVRKTVDDDATGLTRFRQRIYVFFYCYVYDPIATGFRFFRLVFIFAPVVLSVPAVCFGRRVKDDNNQNNVRVRTGTLWWYGFLVSAMERAGPAFIKVWKMGLFFFFFFLVVFSNGSLIRE